jgi:hypothetical protein
LLLRRLLLRRPSPALVLAIIAVFVAGAGSATAARLITGKQIKNGSIGSADLKRSVRAKLGGSFVKVGPDGAVLGSRNVGAVTHSGPGDFRVAYKRNLEKCALVATVRGTADAEFYGFITTYVVPPTTARVVIRNALGIPSDGQGFSLTVAC